MHHPQTTRWRRQLALIAAATTLAVAGCGAEESDTSKVPATSSAPDAMAGMEGMDHGGDSGSMGDMVSLGSVTRDGVKLGLEAMTPETFYVAEGTSQVQHAVKSDDSVHLMVTLADADSGIRLPDASVTAQVKGPDGQVAFDGPLYPMIGRGMGLHYGENIALTTKGDYAVTLVSGPPRVGRHTDVKDAWSKTVKLPLKLRWDGSKATPVS